MLLEDLGDPLDGQRLPHVAVAADHRFGAEKRVRDCLFDRFDGCLEQLANGRAIFG